MIKLLAALLLTQTTPAQSPPPADAAVLKALRQPMMGVPFVYEEHRGDLLIVKSPLCTARVPLLLPAGAVVGFDVTHWECKVHYTETVRSLYPFPVTMKKKRVQTVYLDTVAPAK